MPCIEEKCSGRASYNYKDLSRKYCVDHSTVGASTGTDGMITNPKSICEHDKRTDHCFLCSPNSNYFCIEKNCSGRADYNFDR